ncbi:MAG: SDR family oxidoreductase, partial [Holophagales bacterium]|nr:SDR family oxidoreductase [Holophagales bacterium]
RIVGKTGISEAKARKILEKQSPQNRVFTAEEVAFQVRHLCEPASGGMNGQSLVLDGGAVQT